MQVCADLNCVTYKGWPRKLWPRGPLFGPWRTEVRYLYIASLNLLHGNSLQIEDMGASYRARHAGVEALASEIELANSRLDEESAHQCKCLFVSIDGVPHVKHLRRLENSFL